MGNRLRLGKYLDSPRETEEEDNDDDTNDKEMIPLDVLAWWKCNQQRYPILSKIARDILAIPASTVASEASFSASGRVVNEYRTRLKPDLIEALVCLKDWERAEKRKQDDDQEKMLDEEIKLVTEYENLPEF